MKLCPLLSPTDCGCWSSCLPKMTFFHSNGRTLERQREEEQLRQLQRERSEMERRIEVMRRKLKRMEKEESKRKLEEERQKEKREMAELKMWTVMEWERVSKKDRKEREELDKQLQLKGSKRNKGRAERKKNLLGKEPISGSEDALQHPIRPEIGAFGLEDRARWHQMELLRCRQRHEEIRTDLEKIKEKMAGKERHREEKVLDAMRESLVLFQQIQEDQKTEPLKWNEREHALKSKKSSKWERKERKERERQTKREELEEVCKRMEKQVEEERRAAKERETAMLEDMERKRESERQEMERQLKKRQRRMEKELRERLKEREMEREKEKKLEREQEERHRQAEERLREMERKMMEEEEKALREEEKWKEMIQKQEEEWQRRFRDMEEKKDKEIRAEKEKIRQREREKKTKRETEKQREFEKLEKEREAEARRQIEMKVQESQVEENLKNENEKLREREWREEECKRKEKKLTEVDEKQEKGKQNEFDELQKQMERELVEKEEELEREKRKMTEKLVVDGVLEEEIMIKEKNPKETSNKKEKIEIEIDTEIEEKKERENEPEKQREEGREKERSERQLETEIIQKAREEHMKKDKKQKKEWMKRIFGEGSIFRSQHGAERRGSERKRSNRPLMVTEGDEKQDGPPEQKTAEPLSRPVSTNGGPRLITVRPLNSSPGPVEELKVTSPQPADPATPTSTEGGVEEPSPEQHCATEEKVDETSSDSSTTSGMTVDDLSVFALRPAPQGTTVRCHIKRDMKTTDNSLHPIFHMYLEEDDGKKKFLLSARNISTTMTANYVVSVDPSGWYHEDENVVGKLRSNMLGTKFTLCGKSSTNSKNSRALLKGRSPEQELTTIHYEADLMGGEGPRKMSIIIPGMNVNSERSPVHSIKDQRSLLKRWQKPKLENVIQLRNKDAVWNDVSKGYDLNFSGLTPRASRRNFQLIHAEKPDNILMVFARMADNEFTLHYSYPLCALQAFSIGLSSIHSKLACV